MKTKFLFIALFVLLASCSNDSDAPRQLSISGEWDLIQMKENGVNIPLTACQSQFSGLEFLNNTQCIETDGEIFNNVCQSFSETENYFFVDSVFTVQSLDGDFMAKYNVVTLDSSQFVITIFYVKEVQNGVVMIDQTLPENERITFFYNKI